MTAPLCPICGVRAIFAQRVLPAVYHRCLVCDALFQYPMPSIEQMREYVEREYAAGVYSDYAAASHIKSLTFARRALLIAARAPVGRLLDVGASCGFFVQEALSVGFDAYGVEFSSEAIAKASAHIAGRLKLGDINLLAATEANSFDVITAFDVLEHVFRPVDFLADLRRVARPGALITITTPDTNHFLRYLLGARWPMFQPMQHMVLFSQRSLRLALSRAGYEEIEIGAATKSVTADYLAGQIEMYLPTLVRAYRVVAPFIPVKFRTSPVNVNIGELLAFARVPTEN